MEERIEIEIMGKINDLEFFEKAKKFVVAKHKGQARRDGTPYVSHVIRVADIVLKFKDDSDLDELVVAALLHDTLEDTDTGISELRENFGEVVALLVVELTTDRLRAKVVGKAKYLADKFSDEKAISSWGLVIKLADRLDNISDLDNVGEDFSFRYRNETLDILDALERKRKLTRTHKKLIVAIREKLAEVGL